MEKKKKKKGVKCVNGTCNSCEGQTAQPETRNITSSAIIPAAFISLSLASCIPSHVINGVALFRLDFMPCHHHFRFAHHGGPSPLCLLAHVSDVAP